MTIILGKPWSSEGKWTVERIQDVLAGMDANRGDDESAHAEEDRLHCAILLAVAEGRCDDPRACAREALKSLDIAFARWCA